VIAEPHKIVRREELRVRIGELEAAIAANHRAVGALGVSRVMSLGQAAPELHRLGAERGQLLTEWNLVLREYADLN
jgi:hypothetical protein